MPHKDPEVARQYHKQYREKNRESIKAKIRVLQKQNKEKYALSSLRYQQRARKDNINYRISCSMRSRIGNMLRYIGLKRYKSLYSELLGCSKEDFKLYLSSKFTDGMSWDNYGRTGWHIDHITPLSSFDLTNEDELAAACHYTNMQPLWARDNIIKGNKIEKDEEK